MLREGNTDDAQRVRYAFVRLAGRQPSEEEVALLVELYVAQRSLFERQPESAQKLIAQGGPPTAENLQPVELNPIELAAATVVAQTILNLDATVWKR